MTLRQWSERQRYFIDFTIASLLRRKGKNTALVACYALLVFLVASVMFFSSALRHEAHSALQGAPEMLVQRLAGGRHDPIPLRYAETIARIRGVSDVKPRWWGYYYHPAAKANYTVMAIDPFDYPEDAAVVGNGVYRTWPVGSDRRLFISAFDGQIVHLNATAVLAKDTELLTTDLILVAPAMFQRLFGEGPDRATDLAVTIRNRNEASTIAHKVLQALPDTRPILREEIIHTYDALFDWRSGYVIVLLGGAGLAFLIFALDRATGLSAEEKREVAILKAVGWDTGDILQLKFWEGIVISLTAYLVGVILAYWHVFLLPAPLFEHALKGWATLYPHFQLQPVVSLYQLAVVLAFTVLPYTLITIVPSWRVAVTDPDTVMRQG